MSFSRYIGHPLRRMARALDTTVDLSEDLGFVIALLDSPEWRSRLVEEFTFSAASHVRVSSSYQVEFPLDLIAPFVDVEHHKRANVLLPLTTRPKRPLLNLDIVGPGGAAAHLLTRSSTAALQAQYLRGLVDTSTKAERLRRGLPENLLEAICSFTPDYFDLLLTMHDGVEDYALASYLESGLGEGIELTLDDVRRWRDAIAPAAASLAEHGRAIPPGLSSSEMPLLAIPRVEPLPRAIRQIDTLVDGYVDAIATANETNDSVLLAALAEYGRRYELIIEVEVPLYEPSTITVSEDRPLRMRRGGWVEQTFGLGDARSAHMEARVSDPNVVIGEPVKIVSVDGREIGLGPFESARLTDESLALYSSEAGRPDFARVLLRLLPRRHVRSASVVLMALNVAAIAIAVVMPHDAVLVERLALLTVPTTLAATFVLVREQTALAARLLTATRVALGVSTVLLWIVVLALLVTFHPPSEQQRPPASTSPKVSEATR